MCGGDGVASAEAVEIRAKGAKKMPRLRYECSLCGKDYDTEQRAIVCEKTHVSIRDETRVIDFKEHFTQYNPLPYRLEVWVQLPSGNTRYLNFVLEED